MLQHAKSHAINALQLTFEKLSKGMAWRLRDFHASTLQWITIRHRNRLDKTLFVGVAGSVGKTTTKDLVASILERHFGKGCKNPGSLNWPEDMVRVVLATRKSDAFCVVEISEHGPGALNLPLQLVRPRVGVVTNVNADHLSAFKTRDAIGQEVGKLITALPSDGVAILSADDSRVLAMRANFPGRTVTYGLTDGAMLRGTNAQSNWPERLSIDVTWNGESVHIKTKLCGTHWMTAVLAALATGVALGVPLKVAAQAVADVDPFEGRMAPVETDGISFIRDDWKAPLATIEPAFEFMRQAQAVRKVIVMGTISDYQGDSTRRYMESGQQALAVADSVVFVGARASAALRAKRHENDNLRAFASLRDAAAFLSGELKPGDLVLMKGSHKADHMQRLIMTRTSEVQCWRSDCGRLQSCETCELLHVPSGPKATEESFAAATTLASLPGNRSMVFIIGLGNPEAGRVDTPHNVGFRAVDVLAERLAQNWVPEGARAMMARGEWQGVPICLIKPLIPVNDVGPVLFKLASDFTFNVAQCILLHDDLNLPIGTVRARARGSDGGHRGVRSILQSFQDDKFRRIKIGVGQPNGEQSIVDYVLTPFPMEQRVAIDVAISAAADRVFELIRKSTTS